MEFMLTVALAVIFFVPFAMKIGEGLWGNAITFFNVLTSGLIATNYFEPAAVMIEEQVKMLRYFSDYIAFWVVFSVCFIILKLATDRVSRVKVRFRKPLETGGGVFFAVLIGWMMVTFSLFTFHMAPLEAASFGGSFQKEPTSKMFLGLAPDQKWLGFIQTTSNNGALDRFGDQDPANNFDPNGDFIFRYRARRKALEAEQGLFPE